MHRIFFQRYFAQILVSIELKLQIKIQACAISTIEFHAVMNFDRNERYF